MFNIVKSEWYRFSHMRSVVLSLIVGTLGIALMPLLDATAYYDSFLHVTGTVYLGLFCSGGIGIASILLPVFIIFLSGYYEDKGYKSKITNYQLMFFPNKIEILLGKSLVEGGIISVSVILPICIIMMFFGYKNGMTDIIYGDMFAKMVPLRIFVVFLSCFHIIVIIILGSYWFKSGTKGALFTFMWFFVKGYIGLIFRDGLGRFNAMLGNFGEPFVAIRLAFEGIEEQYGVLFLWIPIVSMLVEIALFSFFIVLKEKRELAC